MKKAQRPATTSSSSGEHPRKPAKKKAAKQTVKKGAAARAGGMDLPAVMAWMEQHASAKVREGMQRYAIPCDDAYGISVGDLRKLAKSIGKNPALAAELWSTARYEPRMLATFIDDAALVSSEQMDRWCGDFDSWAICDTACFALFDRTAYAWDKVETWAADEREFVRRASFALLASLTVHDKHAPDAPYQRGLELIEQYAEDDRNFVKKGVNWALRSIGKRNAGLHAAAVAVSQRLAASSHAGARWIGKDALRELGGDSVARRLAQKKTAKKK